jgi:glycerol-3-phosphate dehydrogenase
MASRDQTIVVLGAGINGAALARELVLSGVSVVVIDADDLAGGATAWSTRLIHGGLRYLEHGELALVRESLAERDRLVRLAPHLVAPLPFYFPVRGRLGGLRAAAARLVGWESLARRCRGERGRGSWTVAAGLAVYDLLSAGARREVRWPRHRMVRAGGAGLPAVDAGVFPLAGVYADAQLLYPERFTVELLVDARRIAAANGARFSVLTHHAASLLSDGSLRATPLEPAADGEAAGLDLRPDAVVNATGAWVDRTLDGIFPPASGGSRSRLIGGTKGSHLILRSARLREAIGGYGVYAEADDGRPVFVLPFGPTLVLVGTTDIPFAGDPAAARADEAEIAYLLAAVARIFPHAAARREDVQQHYCGVRPLPATSDGGRTTPAAVTRRHLLVRHPWAPLPAWSIVGGKLTTCRSLAESAAAEVLAAVGAPVLATSREQPLPGCWPAGTGRDAAVDAATDSGTRAGLTAGEARRVAEGTVALFGARAAAVVAAEPCTPARGTPPLIHGLSLPLSAVGFCVREEWAANLDDLVERRLMLSFDERLSVAALDDVATQLVRAGRLPPERAADAVAACVRRLRDRYGREIPAAVGEQTARPE